jgi:L-arabinose isomerase
MPAQINSVLLPENTFNRIRIRSMSLNRPGIGLLLMSAEWFAQIGADQGLFKELSNSLHQDEVAIVQALSAELEVMNPGILTKSGQVRDAVEQFQKADVDLVVACQITWGEDRLILEAARQMSSVPFLLWCYSPFQRLPEQMTMADLLRSSGPVGTVQASGPLKRLEKPFGFAFGSYDNPETIRKIVVYAKAAQVAKGLGQVRIGVLPHPCDQMTGTYVDDARLKIELGPELRYISVHDYRDICEQIPSDQITERARDLSSNFNVTPEVTKAGLERAVRASLGLALTVRKYDLDAIAIEDVGEELHRIMGIRPCLYVPELFDRAVVSMEADVGAAVSLWILKRLSGKAPMYTETFTYDEGENTLLMGHAGIHDLELADRRQDVLIEPDGEYLESEPDSAWMRFRAKGGHVTLLSIFYDTPHFKLILSQGEALPGKEKLLGSPHILVKKTIPVAEFFEKSIRTGMTQHWMVVHADVMDQLIALAEILGLEKVVI